METASSPLALDNRSSSQHGPLVSDRVEYLLRKEVASRRHESNAQLKHELELAEQFKVSRKTVRAAVERLKKDNLVYAIRGKGTFIKPQKRTEMTLVSSHKYHPHSMMAVSVATSLLRQHGYSPNLVISNSVRQDWSDIENEQSASMGTMLIGVFPEEDLCWLAKNARRPFALVGDSDASVRKPACYNHVLPDNKATIFRATDYLIDRGHTKIGHLTWGEKSVYMKEFRDGFATALSSRGIEPNPAWSIALSPVEFSESSHPNLCPMGETKIKFDRWFDNNDVPTALIIHSALELQIRDILESCGRNHFSLESIIVIGAYEQLHIGYSGIGEMGAACFYFEYLVKRAMALIEQSGQSPPMREISDQSFICRRENGCWKRVATSETTSHEVHQPSLVTSD